MATAAAVTASGARAPQSPAAARAYRPDIDGLRALAVIAVFLFHYVPALAPGGFIGVDIFFVISGYLITGILLRTLSTRSFSAAIIDFYQRRVRRIFPAVVLALSACLVLGWLTLFASEYRALGKSIFGAAGFAENILLWRDVGYFDASPTRKPLLHFWSLAVEEQFYFFWPPALWFILRRRWSPTTAILLIALASFLLNIWAVTHEHSTAAFYLPFTRTWELMAGAWLAAAHRDQPAALRNHPDLQAGLGLALILAGLALTRPGPQFPGYWALLPVLGTVLLINAGPQSFLNRSALSWRPAVWIGLISYPLYLWHWLLLSFSIKLFGSADATGHGLRRVLAAALSVALAYATYRWVERPLRRGNTRTTLRLLLAGAGIAAAGLGVYAANGAPGRALTLVVLDNERYLQTAAWTPLRARCFDRVQFGNLRKDWTCTLGDAGSKNLLVATGDSHSMALIPALDRYGKTRHVRIIYAGMSTCPALLGVSVTAGSFADRCRMLTARVANLATTQHATAVVLAQRWSIYAPHPSAPARAGPLHAAPPVPARTQAATLALGVATSARHYAKAGIRLALIEDNPRQQESFGELTTRLRFDDAAAATVINQRAVKRAQHVAAQQPYNRILESVAAKAGADIVRLDDALCLTEHCPWVMHDRLLYFDEGHLSVSGALQVYPLLAAQLDAILGIAADADVRPADRQSLR